MIPLMGERHFNYDAAGTRLHPMDEDLSLGTPECIAKGSLTSFSCNFATNGFAATTSWVLGPGPSSNSEQVTEYAVTGAPGSYASTWKHTNVFANGGLLATYTGSDTIFALEDWLGSKRVEVGASGCASTFTSLPFGNGMPSSPQALSGHSACIDATEQHFTGKERDTESGNDYFGARYYASSIGRFMSPDAPFADQHPINPQSWNLYTYTLNSPLSNVDTDGSQSLSAPAAKQMLQKYASQAAGGALGRWNVTYALVRGINEFERLIGL